MRKLCLVGMAPPQDKKKETPPFPSGHLSSLVALDPRHGVFPNLVMTPLLATLASMHNDLPNREALYEQLAELLADSSPRRFNLLEKPIGSHLTMSQEAQLRVDQMRPESELWLVFGYWTNCALLMYLTTRQTSFDKGTLDAFVREFLRRSLQDGQAPFPRTVPSARSAITGLLCRLCSEEGALAGRLLREGLANMKECQSADTERVVKVLRSVLPLPHNEAYQNVPFGKIQNCFMLVADPEDHGSKGIPSQVFWRYMGALVKRKLTVTEV